MNQVSNINYCGTSRIEEIESTRFRCKNKNCSKHNILNKEGPHCSQCGKKSEVVLVIEVHHYEYQPYYQPIKYPMLQWWEVPPITYTDGTGDITPSISY